MSMVRRLIMFIVLAVIIAGVGGMVYFAVADIPAPVQPVEVTVPYTPDASN